MDREIKFRAWDKLSEEMIEDILHLDNQENNSFGQVLKDDTKIVMQFTGLRDKDGKDIYEGDILEIKDPWESNLHVVEYGGEVDDYPAFDLKPILHREANSLQDAFLNHSVQVVGNKFENPDLLENI